MKNRKQTILGIIYSAKMHKFARRCRIKSKGLHFYLTPFIRVWTGKFGWQVEDCSSYWNNTIWVITTKL